MMFMPPKAAPSSPLGTPLANAKGAAVIGIGGNPVLMGLFILLVDEVEVEALM